MSRAALEVFPLPPINDETLPIMRPALAAPGPRVVGPGGPFGCSRAQRRGCAGRGSAIASAKGGRSRTAVSCVDARRRAGRDVPIWPASSNRFGWTSYLGDAKGTDGVSPYAAAARATDFCGLPPAIIVVGGLDGCVDEDIGIVAGRVEPLVFFGGGAGPLDAQIPREQPSIWNMDDVA